MKKKNWKVKNYLTDDYTADKQSIPSGKRLSELSLPSRRAVLIWNKPNNAPRGRISSGNPFCKVTDWLLYIMLILLRLIGNHSNCTSDSLRATVGPRLSGGTWITRITTNYYDFLINKFFWRELIINCYL